MSEPTFSEIYTRLKNWRDSLAAPTRKPRPTNHQWNRHGRTKPKHGHKFCNTCGEEKPKAEFYRNIGTADGFQNHCKACQRKKNAVSNKRRKRNVHA